MNQNSQASMIIAAICGSVLLVSAQEQGKPTLNADTGIQNFGATNRVRAAPEREAKAGSSAEITVLEALQAEAAKLLLPGEVLTDLAAETIEEALDGTTSAWCAYTEPSETPESKEKAKATRRTRYIFVNPITRQERTAICNPANPGEPPQMTCPPAPMPGKETPYMVSSKNVSQQIKNARPDTFYIDPPNYNKLGLRAAPGTITIGTQKSQPCFTFIVPTPGQNLGCRVKFTASWWDKGLRGWFVTELPKKTEGKVQLSFNYSVMNFKPETPGTTGITVSPVFSTRKGIVEPVDVGALDTEKLPCGQSARSFSESYPIPERATHFTIRPGFSGKDRGHLTLWNIKITTGEKSAEPPAEKPPIPGGDETVDGESALENEVFKLVNQARASAGLRPLTQNSDLTRAARYHARDMMEDAYFDHDSYNRENGSLVRICDPFTRISRFYAKPSAENIAKGQSSAEKVMDSWMNSPGHRKNILSPTSNTIGVGFVNNHWVQNFGY